MTAPDDQPAPKSPAFHHITDLLTANLNVPSQTADQIALLLVEDEDALLAALGHDNCARREGQLMPSETNLHLNRVSAWQPMLHTDHDHTPALVSIRVGDPYESWVSLYAEVAELAAALRDAADKVDRLGDHAAEMVLRAEDEA